MKHASSKKKDVILSKAKDLLSTYVAGGGQSKSGSVASIRMTTTL
jgi:hypothetical protein